jgi:hypothetical protein
VVLGHRLLDTKFAFADRMMIGDAELLATIAMRREAAEEAAADAKVVEMLDRSPYKDKLASAGLFLRIVAERSKMLPELIQPHVGDHVSGKEAQRLSELMTRAPELKHQDLTQVPALPIGARLVVDPWDGKLELLRSAAALPSAIREKTPLAITPLTPHLKYPAGTAMPLQPRALPRAANPAPAPVAVATDVAPTVPSVRPVPDLTLPESGPSVPELKVVPDIGPLPQLTPVAPAIREVPVVAPEPDLCAIEGTDLACGPKVQR